MGPNHVILDDSDANLEQRPVPNTYYVLAETPCPYLPGFWERKLLTEIRGPKADYTYNLLSRAGFRRSHFFAYRPACDGCTACLPVRVVAQDFVPSKSMKRIAALNRDLTVTLHQCEPTQEQYDLFNRYITLRHQDGEMAGMTFADYSAMVEQTNLSTRLVEFRNPENQLVAACLIDWLQDGPSAVYSFFEPDLARRSLGSYMVLWLIKRAQQESRPYVYLGYWIQQTPKMSYKIRFRPAEVLGQNGWTRIEELPEPVKHTGILPVK